MRKKSEVPIGLDEIPAGHAIWLADLKGWSRNTLELHIDFRLLKREGKAVSNFQVRLPMPQSDPAHDTLQDRLGKFSNFRPERLFLDVS